MAQNELSSKLVKTDSSTLVVRTPRGAAVSVRRGGKGGGGGGRGGGREGVGEGQHLFVCLVV